MQRLFAILIAIGFTFASTLANAAGYADWAAIVVAGDWHAHDGSASEAFDNARRDVSIALARIGFDPANIEQFSVRPNRYPTVQPMQSDPQIISNALWDLSNRTSGGCLLYFSSHGSGDGVVLGEKLYAPDALASVVSNSCGDRPTVVIISACFSGVFVPALAGPTVL
jgi:hypothetical protein